MQPVSRRRTTRPPRGSARLQSGSWLKSAFTSGARTRPRRRRPAAHAVPPFWGGKDVVADVVPAPEGQAGSSQKEGTHERAQLVGTLHDLGVPGRREDGEPA